MAEGTGREGIKMMWVRLRAVAAAGVLAVGAGSAWAGGLYTPGFPLAGQYPNTSPPTGNETIPLDTNLPEGVEPQTEAMTLNQLASFLGGGGGSTFGQTFPTTGTAIGAYNGGNMVYVAADSSHNLDVNCVAGCSAGTGTFANNSDAVATSSTNGQAAAWLYAFNGSTWDRLRDDGGKNLYVNLATALPAGGNTIGAVSQAGSWTIASITAQALPTGASTSALQSATQGTVGAGTAASASTLVGGIYNSSPITLGSGQGAALQTDANGYLKINLAAGGGSGGTASSFGAAFPGLGTAMGAYNGANMVYVAADSSHNLQVNCTVGCSSSGGSSLADEGTFTQGTTSFTVMGGFYNSAPASLSSGQGGAVQLTADRQMYVNLGKVLGTATAVGAGATNAGTQRVDVAQDTSTIAGAAPGSAGSPSVSVVSVQGVASGTALPVVLSGTNNINAITVRIWVVIAMVVITCIGVCTRWTTHVHCQTRNGRAFIHIIWNTIMVII